MFRKPPQTKLSVFGQNEDASTAPVARSEDEIAVHSPNAQMDSVHGRDESPQSIASHVEAQAHFTDSQPNARDSSNGESNGQSDNSGSTSLDDSHTAVSDPPPNMEPAATTSGRDSDYPPAEQQQGESAVRAVREFLMGEVSEVPRVENSRDREAVAAELLRTMNRAETAESDTIAQSPKDRARQVFLDHGYFDEVTNQLRTSEVVSERVEAARVLGWLRSERGTAPLIAALFDDAAEVRGAAGHALEQIGDPAVTPLAGLDSETDFGVPQTSTPIKVAEGNVAGTVETAEPASIDADNFIQEQEGIHRQIGELEDRLQLAAVEREAAEEEVGLRYQQECALRAEAAARRHEDEEARKRAEEKAARRRYEDERNVAAEHLARVRAEEEAQSLILIERQLRQEALSLSQAAEEIANDFVNKSAVRREERLTTARDEAEALRVAEETHQKEIELLKGEQEALRVATDMVVANRTELESMRSLAESENEQLLLEKAALAEAEEQVKQEAARVGQASESNRQELAELTQRSEKLRKEQEDFVGRRSQLEVAEKRAVDEERELKELEERTEAAEENRRQLQAERMRLESEIRERTASEEHLLFEVRRHAAEERERLEESVRLRMAEQDRLNNELEALRNQLEEEARQRKEREQQLLSDVETFRVEEAEMRRRLADAESRRRSAEESDRLIAERVQKLEAEAHLRATAEERALVRLEEVRRNIAIKSEARAEQQARITKEIESLRATENQMRERIEEEMRLRGEAEIRLQQGKERLKAAEQAHARVEAQLDILMTPAAPSIVEEWRDDPVRNLRKAEPPTQRVTQALKVEQAASQFRNGIVEASRSVDLSEEMVVRLSSDDANKRAEAIATLPSIKGKDAFSLILNFFDDPAQQVRNVAARALHELEPLRPVEFFTRALEEASDERRRTIGAAIAQSGLAEEALNDLDADSREDTYNALCLLFVMAKTGEVSPLVEAIEKHKDLEVRRAAIKLLNLSGQSELADAAAKRRLGHNR